MKDADLPLGTPAAPRPDRREQLWRARPLDCTKGDNEQHRDPNLPQTRTARAPPRAALLTSPSINSIPSGQHLPHTFRAECKPHIQGPRPATHHHPQTQGAFVPWHPLPAINSIPGVAHTAQGTKDTHLAPQRHQSRFSPEATGSTPGTDSKGLPGWAALGLEDGHPWAPITHLLHPTEDVILAAALTLQQDENYQAVGIGEAPLDIIPSHSLAKAACFRFLHLI